jgi:hypothetical protein
MRTIIGHSSGEWIATDYPVYMGDNRNQAQAFAAGITTARRLGLSLALGLCPEDDDDNQSADMADEQPKTPRRAPRAATTAASGGAARPLMAPEGPDHSASGPSPALPHILSAAEFQADYGRKHFTNWWRHSAPQEWREALKPHRAALLDRADAADRNPKAAPSTPAEDHTPENPQPPQERTYFDAAGNPLTILDGG